ncbi:MAG: hypothetical protein H6Q88_3539 [Anaeromyxobacteraceae bacterium]|nr:hypothetical protein [Anaeromyxobacteraceae bacterium]
MHDLVQVPVTRGSPRFQGIHPDRLWVFWDPGHSGIGGETPPEPFLGDQRERGVMMPPPRDLAVSSAFSAARTSPSASAIDGDG